MSETQSKKVSDELKKLTKLRVSKWRIVKRWLVRDVLPEQYYHSFIVAIRESGLQWSDVRDDIVQAWNSAKYSVDKMYGLTQAWMEQDDTFFRKKATEKELIESIINSAKKLKELNAGKVENGTDTLGSDAETKVIFQAALEHCGWIPPEQIEKKQKEFVKQYIKSQDFVNAAANLFVLWERYRNIAGISTSIEDFKSFLKECQTALTLDPINKDVVNSNNPIENTGTGR